MLKAIFGRIDESRFLANLLMRVSNLWARKRGAPVVIGIVLVIVSFSLWVVNLGVDSNTVDVVAMLTLYAGVLMALVGLALAVPLGK